MVKEHYSEYQIKEMYLKIKKFVKRKVMPVSLAFFNNYIKKIDIPKADERSARQKMSDQMIEKDFPIKLKSRVAAEALYSVNPKYWTPTLQKMTGINF